MHIHCIQTGGTIDKQYPQGAPHHGYNFEITTPAIVRILQESHVREAITVIELLKKDSLDITDADRERIVETVAHPPHTHIIITHGTDTIKQTAAALSVSTAGKTIVLTGAMLPESMKGSDAGLTADLRLLHCTPANRESTSHYTAVSLPKRNFRSIPHEIVFI